ncbi:glucosaminidase domain-containing protein [Sellimonas sp.]|uniref:glucosaminidase domain-containing protein n=1 Tax=Sellimonas sp. TaxID=2021466 RepID=UPI002579CD42|nr:glucosaminidase domain-containing protein [Sellimonas sp.]
MRYWKKAGIFLAAFLLLTGIGEVKTAQAEETLKDENPQRIESVTGMQTDGTVLEQEQESGIVEEKTGRRAARSSAVQLVNFNTKASGQTTSFTMEGTNQSGYTYGPYGADGIYLGESDGKVRFMLSGTIGLVNASDVQIVDFSAAKAVSYYTVSNGRLIHYIATNMQNGTYGSTLDNGPAPSYLKSGAKYYSYDGHYFYTEDKLTDMVSDYSAGRRTASVNPSQPFYNYFQFLPMRSKTAFSASELNAAINSKTDSSSKMYNMGSEFINKQNTYGTNALLMTGVAANESAWGKSNIAQTKNNLFGLNAVDSSPGESANYYADVSTCIKDFSETYMSMRYLRPGYSYYKGGFLGNKAAGINVHYASDPYWGEKAANVAWNLDKAAGNKDAGRYTLGVKDVMTAGYTTLNVRKERSASATKLYSTVKNPGYTFILLENDPISGFYKVQSDGVLDSARETVRTDTGNYDYNQMYAYASQDYITKVNTGSGTGGSGAQPPAAEQGVSYSAHVQTYGWQNYVSNGATAGTTGQSKRLEAVKIKLSGQKYAGNIEYSAHVQTYGWQDYVSNDATGGVIGQSKRLEALKIRLTGEMAENYDVYYRVHAQNFGWLGWAKNDAPAGTAGYSYRLEAIEICLVEKGKSAPGSVKNAYKEYDSSKPAGIKYEVHVQDKGWQSSANGNEAGTTGESLRLEGMKVTLDNQPYAGTVEYSAHVQGTGWQSKVSDGDLSGTTGQSKRMEAITINLTGTMAEHYDIYYRVHAQRFGWLGWAKNGQAAGTSGYSYRLEALQIQLVPKGGNAPGEQKNCYKEYDSTKPASISYSGYVEGKGWIDPVTDGAEMGSTGSSLRLEGIRIALQNQPSSGMVEYRAHIQGTGWQNVVSDGATAGTPDLGKRMEAIEISLTGDMAKEYDVYYRAHVQKLGWLGWAKNGEPAGTSGLSYRIESIQIQLVEKGGKAPEGNEDAYISL